MMKSTHIWAGQIASNSLLETYLDQSMYLKAWAKYDHELPRGNEDEDAEPSPNLRCQFCKDLGIDTYDEDMMVFRYYDHLVNAATIAKDFQLDSQQLSKLFEEKRIGNCNAVIAYHEDNLKPKKTSNPTLLKHLGQLNNPEMPAGSKPVMSHYLWTGAVKLSKAEIIKSTGLKGKKIDSLNFHHSKEKKSLDEIIILEVQDFDLAERIILKLDSMGISLTTNAVLVLSLDNSFKIDIKEISKALGMDFIAEFKFSPYK